MLILCSFTKTILLTTYYKYVLITVACTVPCCKSSCDGGHGALQAVLAGHSSRRYKEPVLIRP